MGAQAGTLTFMVGGEDAVFNAVKPALEDMGKNIVHCGGVGTGQVGFAACIAACIADFYTALRKRVIHPSFTPCLNKTPPAASRFVLLDCQDLQQHDAGHQHDRGFGNHEPW